MSEATSGTSVPEGPSGVAGLFGATPELQGGWETTQPTLVLPCLDGSSQLLAGADKVRADEAVYVATKHAQAGLARSLGMQADEQKLPVKVALFLPGAMKTPFWNGRELPADYAFFNDPAKIATHIINAIEHQQQPYLEWALPKGTLV